MNLSTLPQAVLVSLPTSTDLLHAAQVYGAIVGCAVTLWVVAAVVGTIADHVKQARLEHKQFVIRRLMEGDGKR